MQLLMKSVIESHLRVVSALQCFQEEADGHPNEGYHAVVRIQMSLSCPWHFMTR